MKIRDYLNVLERPDRAKLAVEIECSLGYINQLATYNDSLSIKKAHRILQSEFNKSLPEHLQFTEEDYNEHRYYKMEKRASQKNGG